ncbi:VOC family protein [Gottfriedia sp. NPDC058432]|uniref:VOC family protein n=1 Tax=Gottfriedia sp. NPDC058432 TaxID=3346497 RepID=UPI003659CCDD
MAKQMSKLQTYISPLLKIKCIRELILLPSTLSGKRQLNKTEEYPVTKTSLISQIERVAIYVSDLENSMDWYIEKLGFTLENITDRFEVEVLPNQIIRCALLNTKNQRNALVLVERRDTSGKKILPSTNGYFHIAFEIEEQRSSFEFAQRLKEKNVFISYGPVKHSHEGDGEIGGNIAVYCLDPDNHYLEFFFDMDKYDSLSN